MTVNAPLYLDYHATTPCDPSVVEAMLPYFSVRFGNVSSNHARGRHADKALTEAKAQIAGLIGAQPEEIVLTSGATESNNLALAGIAAGATDRREILIGALEHESVARCARHLVAQGFTVKVIPATKDGFILPDAVAGMVSDKTLMVSVLAASHEIGTIQPIKEIAAVAKRAGAWTHCDAAQAVGRVAIDVGALGVDMLSFSAHKIYGPQGIGALYVRAKPPVSLFPLFHGGHQQRLRPGTVPLALAAGFGQACRIAAACLKEDARRLSDLTDLLVTELTQNIPGIRINGARTSRLPGSLNVLLPGVDAEALLLTLADDLCLSTGSACRSKGGFPSPVLRAIGLSDQDIYSSIRLSLGRATIREDVFFAVKKITAAIDESAVRNLKVQGRA